MLNVDEPMDEYVQAYRRKLEAMKPKLQNSTSQALYGEVEKLLDTLIRCSARIQMLKEQTEEPRKVRMSFHCGHTELLFLDVAKNLTSGACSMCSDTSSLFYTHALAI